MQSFFKKVRTIILILNLWTCSFILLIPTCSPIHSLSFFLFNNATCFFIHFLKRFVLKKGCLRVVSFVQLMPFSSVVYTNIPFT